MSFHAGTCHYRAITEGSAGAGHEKWKGRLAAAVIAAAAIVAATAAAAPATAAAADEDDEDQDDPAAAATAAATTIIAAPHIEVPPKENCEVRQLSLGRLPIHLMRGGEIGDDICLAARAKALGRLFSLLPAPSRRLTPREEVPEAPPWSLRSD